MNFRCGEYKKYESFIKDTEKRYSLPFNLLTVTLYQASKYDPGHIAGKDRRSVGPRAALGIANLTGEDCNVLWNGTDKRLDPLAAIVGCATLLRIHFRRFHNWKHSVIAYHSNQDIVRLALQYHRPMPIDAQRYSEQAQAYCQL